MYLNSSRNTKDAEKKKNKLANCFRDFCKVRKTMTPESSELFVWADKFFILEASLGVSLQNP